MGLSNSATPIYYGQFREAVIGGRIPVNREISMEMNRIDSLIANPNIYYDDEAVNGFIRYCEGELTLTDGADLWPTPFILRENVMAIAWLLNLTSAESCANCQHEPNGCPTAVRVVTAGTIKVPHPDPRGVSSRFWTFAA